MLRILLLCLGASSSFAAIPEIPKSKACPSEPIEYSVAKTRIGYLPTPTGCGVRIQAESRDGSRDYYISTTSSGLFYLWNIPSLVSRSPERTDYKHAMAFLPVTSHPFPYPSEPNEFYLHIPNGENLIVNALTGKIDWKKSVASGLSSILIEDLTPSQKSPQMISIKKYAEGKIFIDFGASATTDPFLIPNARAKLYKFLARENMPRKCVALSKLFRKTPEEFEASFDSEIMNKVLAQCNQQDTWTKPSNYKKLSP